MLTVLKTMGITAHRITLTQSIDRSIINNRVIVTIKLANQKVGPQLQSL
jgi:hypothetical protein